jgi:hypothetical protein
VLQGAVLIPCLVFLLSCTVSFFWSTVLLFFHFRQEGNCEEESVVLCCLPFLSFKLKAKNEGKNPNKRGCRGRNRTHLNGKTAPSRKFFTEFSFPHSFRFLLLSLFLALVLHCVPTFFSSLLLHASTCYRIAGQTMAGLACCYYTAWEATTRSGRI